MNLDIHEGLVRLTPDSKNENIKNIETKGSEINDLFVANKRSSQSRSRQCEESRRNCDGEGVSVTSIARRLWDLPLFPTDFRGADLVHHYLSSFDRNVSSLTFGWKRMGRCCLNNSNRSFSTVSSSACCCRN